MTMQSTIPIPTTLFDDVIARLKLLQSTDTPHKSLVDDKAAICLQNLEALQTSANKRSGVWLTIHSSENLHWITRAIISAISKEHQKLSIQIERLLALLDDCTRTQLCQDLTVQKKAFLQIKKINDQAMSTLGLEQRVVPALLEISQSESLQTHSNLPHTLH